MRWKVLATGLLVAVALAATLHAQNYIWSSINGVPVAPRVLVDNGTVSQPGYGFSSEPNTGLYLYGTNVPAITVAGVLQTAWYTNQFYLKSDTHKLSWGVGDDVALQRVAAGVLTVTNGSTGAGSLLLSRSVEAVTTTKSPSVQESNEVYTNEGDADGATITLPTAAAGYTYTVCIQAAQTLTVTAAAGDTIRLASGVTAAAGSISSNIIGSCVTLQAINATEWYGVSIVGSWSY